LAITEDPTEPSPRPPLSLPWPPLRTTPRVTLPNVALRPWGDGPEDAASLATAWSDPEVLRWTEVPEARSAADAARWVAGEEARRERGLGLDLVIVDPASPEVVQGEVGMVVVEAERRWAEIGYWLLPQWRGHGRSATALGLFSDWALAELPVARLFVRTHAENPASAEVAQRSGYWYAGDLAERIGVWVRDAEGPPRQGGTVPT
jgi:RimJ/RimL family protein N-acetyltransferase